MASSALIAFAASLSSFNAGDASVEVPLSEQELGKKLFFDVILSNDYTVSCSSCHKPSLAFADSTRFSLGIHGIPTKRNAPSVMNLAGRLQLFWDGRVSSLEEQALKPIESADEMNLPINEAVARLNNHEDYSRSFRKIYKAKASAELLAKALAAYERTLETSNTPYDRFLDGDEAAISESAARGRLLFIGKANCANCHAGDDLTADRFKNIGLYNGKDLNDRGRFDVTNDSAHLGLFRIPGLRNVAVTAPYMHNGIFKTLREVLEYYNRPDAIVKGALHRDLSLSTPLNLSDAELTDLEEFLKTLTDDAFIAHQKQTINQNINTK